MSDMVDLKLSKAELKKKSPDSIDEPDRPRFPYGFDLTFHKREVEMLPALKAASAGDEIMIMAKAKVTGVHTNEREGSKATKRVEVQIQKIAVAAESGKEFAAGFTTKQ